MQKTNFHTHCTHCDGRDSAEAMVLSAIEKGFLALGFSSHAMWPVTDGCAMRPEAYGAYVREIRDLGVRYADRIRILCGFEADYVPGVSSPGRSLYGQFSPDYLIGSIHYVGIGEGIGVAVDNTPAILREGIDKHFGGDARAYVAAYFRQEREMVAKCDFDIVGHPDLVRKFNGVLHYFDPEAEWYRRELELTADAIAASGKIVEINVGGFARGNVDDAYPALPFRKMLQDRGVGMLLASDAHWASALGLDFEKFATPETDACAEQFLEVCLARTAK